MREAALLLRMSHPAIMEVLGVFWGHEHESLMIKMPFYSSGTLDQWIVAHQPEFCSVRRVLRDIVGALAHLHDHSVVHADVKPANIMVTAFGQGCLADFDISVNYNERISTVFAATVKTSVGYTAGFDAPELLQTGSTAASDMFAFGKTVESIKTHCEDPSSSARRLEDEDLASRAPSATDEFIRELTATNPSDRPTAEDAIKYLFFQPVQAWRVTELRECSLLLDETCVNGRVALTRGVECSHGHFVCNECLEKSTKMAESEEVKIRRKREGRIMCPYCLTQGRDVAFTDADLAQRLPQESFHSYLSSRLQLIQVH
jgi:serine/threonine protein kinase